MLNSPIEALYRQSRQCNDSSSKMVDPSESSPSLSKSRKRKMPCTPTTSHMSSCQSFTAMNNHHLSPVTLEEVTSPVRSSRKRTRFTDDISSNRSSGGCDESAVSQHDAVQRQIVELILPSSEMTEAERDAIWYKKSDYRSSLMSAERIGRATAADYESELFVDTLANTYAICCLGDSEDSELSDHCAQQLAMVSAASGDEKSHRGLERVTVPTVGLEIVRRRKLVIGSVVLAQRNLMGCIANKEEKQEALRLISESQSRPARKFAKAMGVVDAMGALMEYQA